MFLFFFFKQKTAYEMRISDWSSDVCSSDLPHGPRRVLRDERNGQTRKPTLERAGGHGISPGDYRAGSCVGHLRTGGMPPRKAIGRETWGKPRRQPAARLHNMRMPGGGVDRESGVLGKSVQGRVDPGCRG